MRYHDNMRRYFYLLVLVICMSHVFISCEDDDYSTSPSALLTFSADTISFDTVFSGVPSVTQDFWIFNKGGDHLRLSSVALQRGNQSGFRVNVDGVYLGQTNGYQTSDVEVRSGDSIRVFVELTSATTGSDSPQLKEDNIVFTLESGSVQRVNLNAYSWDAVILDNVVVSESTTYTADKPIVVYGTLTVDSAATLTLAAGTTLYLRDDASIDVYGTLLSLGESSGGGGNVTLRGYRLDNMFDYLPYDRVSGQWGGIRFRESSYGNRLEYTDLHSAFDGIVVDSCDVSKSTLVMNATTVHNCQGYGLWSTCAAIELYNCQLTNSLGDCLFADGGRVTVNNCTFAQFYPYDSNRGVAYRYASTSAPLQMTCQNSLITGYADNELQEGDSIYVSDYLFDHCIIRLDKDLITDLSDFMDIAYETSSDTIVGGKAHFVEIDTDNLKYNFHLDSLSTAVDAADALTAMPLDRDGTTRDSSPDIGAYELRREKREI